MSRGAALGLLLAASLPALAAAGEAKLQLYVMPDTQAWAWNQGGTTLEAWRAVAKALCRQRERFALVLHTGDLVDNPRPVEWSNALSVMRELDACRLPYAVAFGNHDFDNYPAPEPAGDRAWQELRAQLASQPLERGPSGRSALHPLGAGWFVLTADFMPSRADLDWIEQAVRARPGARFVLLNHQCADATGLFAGPALAWCRELLARAPAIRSVVSGHWLGARRESWKQVRREGAPPVIALYQNYQHVPALAPWGVVIELEPSSGDLCVWSENLLDGATRHPDATSEAVGWVGASSDRTCFSGD